MRDGYRCEKDQGGKSCKRIIHGRKIRSEEVEKVLCMIDIRERRRINSGQSEKRMEDRRMELLEERAKERKKINGI